MRKIGFVLFSFLLMGSAWAAEQYGTSAEAKAMLEKAVAEVKKNKDEALEMFIKGEGEFKDRDLYVYCGGPNGNFTAHPTLVGKSLMEFKDKAGKPIGEEMYKSAKEGKVSEISYLWPRPGEEKPVKKNAYYTKVGDQICAVGYYEE
jgi:signal transduction histidine kinase